jgi:hypothetical protein
VRRVMALAVVCAALGLLFAARSHPDPTVAITYPPGWNLISAPDGSLVRGATGVLYTFQPGDTDYQQFPVTTPLRGGYGYWAYFPSGGTVDLAPGTSRYAITLLPGQYVMLGNPSAQQSASVQGADDVELYDPISGTYVPSNVIPAGQGAWVAAQGTVVITGIGPTLPITVAASPTRTATAPALPTSTPPRGNSVPQARCNDGTFDYSTSVNPCAANGGVAYYIGLPSQRVNVTPMPTPAPAP